jgi:serine/threonine protein kinase/tetratricopeptide (TPR) repeat protein
MNPTGLSRYRILDRLGSGGMGVVFRAEDTILRRPVALKFLPGECSVQEESKARLLTEARTAASLNHPNIYIIHEVGEVGPADRFDAGPGGPALPPGTPFIAMELVEGETLHHLLSGQGRLPLDRLADIALQIAEGLSEAHSRGIVHRDLKPRNVMVTPHGRVKILDFGLARPSPRPKIEERETSDAQTVSAEDLEAGKVVGTIAYLSPEQALGKPVDARSDHFSFGTLLYEMATGSRPFRGDGATATLAKILESEPEPIPGASASAPAALQKIIRRCLRKNPAERFEDTRDLVTALKDLSRVIQYGSGDSDESRTAVRPVTPPPPGGKGSCPDAATIAVFPFSVRGSGPYAYLGEGMVDLLGTKLDGAGELHSVDPHALLGRTEGEGGTRITPERAGTLAAELGAGKFVLGNILEMGGQLHIDASLYDSAGGGEVVAKGSVRGEGTRLFEMVDELTTQLLAGHSCGPEARLTRIAALTTGSLSALKAYLDGEKEMRAMRRPPAVEAYRRAVEADPGFALAWYRLAVAALWAGEPGPAIEAVGQAVRHSDRLSERDRRLLWAFHHILRGANEEAGRLYRSIVGDYPDDVEAWYQLGELLFHDGPQHGRPIEESLEAWERLLALDPRHINGWIHWGTIRAGQGHLADLEEAARRVAELGTGGEAGLWMKTIRDFRAGTPEEQARSREELRKASDLSVIWVVRIVGAYLGDLDAAGNLAGILTDPVRSPEIRALGHGVGAYLEVAGGRWESALRSLAKAERLGDGSSIVHRGFLATIPFLPLSREDLESIRGDLYRWDPGPGGMESGTGCWLYPHKGLLPYLRTYLLGLLGARLGDQSAARDQAAALEGMPDPPEAETLKRDLTRSIEAHLAGSRGDPAKVLEILGQTRMETRFDLIFTSPFHSQAAERHLRAESLYRLRQDDRARRWYRTFQENSLFDLAYLAASHLRRGEIHERSGRRPEALRHFTRAADLWRHCDPAFLPARGEAEAGFLRLR